LKEAVIGGEYKTGRIPERRIVLDETKYYEAIALLEKQPDLEAENERLREVAVSCPFCAKLFKVQDALKGE